MLLAEVTWKLPHAHRTLFLFTECIILWAHFRTNKIALSLRQSNCCWMKSITSSKSAYPPRWLNWLSFRIWNRRFWLITMPCHAMRPEQQDALCRLSGIEIQLYCAKEYVPTRPNCSPIEFTFFSSYFWARPLNGELGREEQLAEFDQTTKILRIPFVSQTARSTAFSLFC